MCGRPSPVLPPLPRPHQMNAIERLRASLPQDPHVLGRLLAATRAPRRPQDFGAQAGLPFDGRHVLVAASAEDPVVEHPQEVAPRCDRVKPG